MASSVITTPGAVGEGDFPILCETCLGPNPYVRMVEDRAGRACKVCERPFKCHSWRPGGQGMRPKKTEICQTCARVKNVCQTCLLDLQYNLPVQVRDLSLPESDRQATVVPQSSATREFAAAKATRAIANGEIDHVYAEHRKNTIADRAKRTAPRYERNLSRVCTFYLKGDCKRGLYCPYRHEKPEQSDGLADQNIRDRYYGVNDPVAAKIINRITNPQGKDGNSQALPPTPPEDKSIRTLFVGGLSTAFDSTALRKHFNRCGGVASVRALSQRGIAFVDFVSREAAENAMTKSHGQRSIGGETVSVKWGRSSGYKTHPQSAARAQLDSEPVAKRRRTTDAQQSTGAPLSDGMPARPVSSEIAPHPTTD